MTQIRVTPEELESLSAKINGNANVVSEQISSATAGVQNLVNQGWGGAASAQFDAIWREWASGAQQIQEAMVGDVDVPQQGRRHLPRHRQPAGPGPRRLRSQRCRSERSESTWTGSASCRRASTSPATHSPRRRPTRSSAAGDQRRRLPGAVSDFIDLQLRPARASSSSNSSPPPRPSTWRARASATPRAASCGP